MHIFFSMMLALSPLHQEYDLGANWKAMSKSELVTVSLQPQFHIHPDFTIPEAHLTSILKFKKRGFFLGAEHTIDNESEFDVKIFGGFEKAWRK